MWETGIKFKHSLFIIIKPTLVQHWLVYLYVMMIGSYYFSSHSACVSSLYRGFVMIVQVHGCHQSILFSNEMFYSLSHNMENFLSFFMKSYITVILRINCLSQIYQSLNVCRQHLNSKNISPPYTVKSLQREQ